MKRLIKFNLTIEDLYKNLNYIVYPNRKVSEKWTDMSVFPQYNFTDTSVNHRNNFVEKLSKDKKFERKLITFNPRVGNVRNQEKIKLPHLYMLDLDVKEGPVLDHFYKDLKKDPNTPITDILNNLIAELKEDPYVVYLDKSQSSSGIKAFFWLISEPYLEVINNNKQDEVNFDLYKKIFSNSSIEFEKYLKDKYKFICRYDAKIDYLDQVSFRIGQNTHSSNGDAIYINNRPLPYYVNIDITADEDIVTVKKNVKTKYKDYSKNIYTNLDITKINDMFMKRMYHHFDVDSYKKISEYRKDFINKHLDLLDEESEDQKVAQKIEAITSRLEFEDYDLYIKGYNEIERDIKNQAIPIILDKISDNSYVRDLFIDKQDSWKTRLSIKHLSLDEDKAFFYECFKSFYKGTAMTADLNNGYKYWRDNNIDNNKIPYEGMIIPLKSLLGELGVDNPLRNSSKDSDAYNIKYDESLLFDNYLGDIEEDLFKILDDKKYVVLKAKAGAGKSTLLREYILKKFKEGYTRIQIVIPKNSLLRQNVNIFNDIIKDYAKHNIDICENFGGNNSYKSEDYFHSQKVLVYSSTPKMNLVSDCDLIIIDEAQNLVNYANTIVSNLNLVCQKIVISATPEDYIVYEKDYYYVNVNKKSDRSKKTLNKVITSRPTEYLFKIFEPNKKNVIYLNNKGLGSLLKKDMLEKYPNLKIKVINSLFKKDFEYELDSQFLHEDVLYIVTDYITDGINFNNTYWDNIIILDLYDVKASTLYQLSERFRNASDINLLLITGSKYNTYTDTIHLETRFDILVYEKFLADNKQYVDKLKDIPHTHSHVYSDILKKVDNKLVINVDAVKKKYIEEIFHSLYKEYENVKNGMLSYYFYVNTIFRFSEKDEEFQKSKDLFKNEAYDVYMTLFTDFEDDKINKIEDLYDTYREKIILELNKNRNIDELTSYISTIFSLKEKHDTLRDLNQSPEDIKEILKYSNKKYNSNIKKIRLENIGSSTDISNIEGDAIGCNIYKRQYDLHSIIKSNIVINKTIPFRKTTKDISYFKSTDLLKYFVEHKDVYETFKTIEGETDFSLNEQEISKYLKTITRFFEYKNMNVDNKQQRVFLLK